MIRLKSCRSGFSRDAFALMSMLKSIGAKAPPTTAWRVCDFCRSGFSRDAFVLMSMLKSIGAKAPPTTAAWISAFVGAALAAMFLV
ncbi:MAG: hypothetical protein ABI114_11160 [Rhodanobacter sp.]